MSRERRVRGYAKTGPHLGPDHVLFVCDVDDPMPPNLAEVELVWQEPEPEKECCTRLRGKGNWDHCAVCGDPLENERSVWDRFFSNDFGWTVSVGNMTITGNEGEGKILVYVDGKLRLTMPYCDPNDMRASILTKLKDLGPGPERECEFCQYWQGRADGIHIKASCRTINHCATCGRKLEVQDDS